jgi:hypothetical protein
LTPTNDIDRSSNECAQAHSESINGTATYGVYFLIGKINAQSQQEGVMKSAVVSEYCFSTISFSSL